MSQDQEPKPVIMSAAEMARINTEVRAERSAGHHGAVPVSGSGLGLPTQDDLRDAQAELDWKEQHPKRDPLSPDGKATGRG